MFREKLKVIAKQSLHCGSDNQNTGNVKLQRREPFAVFPLQIESRFKSDSSRRKAIADVLFLLWNEIPSDVRSSRKQTIYDEFYSALNICAMAGDIAGYLEKFCAKFGIRGITNSKVLDLLSKFSDAEFLQAIRKEPQYLFLMFKSAKDRAKEEGTTQVSLFSEIKDYISDDLPANYFEKTIEHIPVISGNSIRHSLRDIAMSFFFEYIGKDNFTKTAYYEYFSGGALTESSGKIDIKKRIEQIEMCPPLGIFGTAKGSDMIEGSLNISHLIPLCKELETGIHSHWELTSFVFGTRSDIAKDEKRFELHNDKSSKDGPQQMLYWTESFIGGTQFELTIALEPIFKHMDILKSCLYHTLKLLKERGYLGGKSSVAHGEVDIELPDDFEGVNEQLYLDYLETRKYEIQEYLKYE
jgi:hypothetical protein